MGNSTKCPTYCVFGTFTVTPPMGFIFYETTLFLASNSPYNSELTENTEASFSYGKIFLKYLQQMYIYETILTQKKEIRLLR